MAEEKKVSRVKSNVTLATGRRKSSIARVRLTTGNGNITVNKREIREYLQSDILLLVARRPLEVVGAGDKYDITVNVTGGGVAGQAGAISHGIARALVLVNETYKKELKEAGLLTRDSRMKERKKYGLKKARKAPQFSKR